MQRNKSADKLLAEYSINQEFKAGECIFSYGEEAKKVYLILDGLVRLFIKAKEEEKEVARLKSGDIIGESALLISKKRSSRAVAYENSTLMIFEPESLKELMHQEAILNENIITSLCARIHRLQQPSINLENIEEEIDRKNNQNKELEDNDNKEGTVKKDNRNKEEDKVIITPPNETPSLYLDGHQGYSQVAKKNFQNYLYTKTIDCPICSKSIDVKKVRHSKLRLKDIRDDLRPIFKDFKPEWYKIWVCPHCFYSARKKDFLNFHSREENKIKAEFKTKVKNSLHSKHKIGYSEPRNLNEVFTAYYLAIKLYNFVAASNDKLAYCWLRLNWIYEDLEEEELSKKASLQALNYFEEFYFNGDTTKLSPSQKDKLTLLLALLFYKHDFGEKALPLLDDLIRSYRTNRRQKMIARDKFMEIRKKRKKEKNKKN